MFLEICIGIGFLSLCGFLIYQLWLKDQPRCLDPRTYGRGKYIEYFMNGEKFGEEISHIVCAEKGALTFITLSGLKISIHCDARRYIVKDGDFS